MRPYLYVRPYWKKIPPCPLRRGLAYAQKTLKIEEIVSESLVACVRGLRTRPRYLVSKGGTTSSDVATKGLDVHKAMVLGQVLPGVPVWRLDMKSRFPGMVYVVFPGNVGDQNALVDVVSKFQKQ